MGDLHSTEAAMSRSKQCFKCKTVKPLTEYYKHSAMGDGYLNKCKDCTKNDVAQHRLSNIEKIREYDRQRGMLPHRVEARTKYAKTKAGKEAITRAHHASNSRHPQKRAARILFGNSLRDGKVTPWPVCAVPHCCNTKLHGHHPDYSQALSVVWLCQTHHREAHKISSEP